MIQDTIQEQEEGQVATSPEITPTSTSYDLTVVEPGEPTQLSDDGFPEVEIVPGLKLQFDPRSFFSGDDTSKGHLHGATVQIGSDDDDYSTVHFTIHDQEGEIPDLLAKELSGLGDMFHGLAGDIVKVDDFRTAYSYPPEGWDEKATERADQDYRDRCDAWGETRRTLTEGVVVQPKPDSMVGDRWTREVVDEDARGHLHRVEVDLLGWPDKSRCYFHLDDRNGPIEKVTVTHLRSMAADLLAKADAIDTPPAPACDGSEARPCQPDHLVGDSVGA